MEKNLLFNDVVVVKEFNPTNSNAPNHGIKNMNKAILKLLALLQMQIECALCLKCLNLQLKN